MDIYVFLAKKLRQRGKFQVKIGILYLLLEWLNKNIIQSRSFPKLVQIP